MAYSLAEILNSTAQLQPKQPAGPRIKSARSRNRAAAHAYDLAQWRAYRLAMAHTDAERDDIERDYAERAAAGPDFTGYHAKSDFSEPHVHDLDRGGKQAVLTAFDQVRGWLWRNSRKPHGQAVSRVYREVLSVLLSFAVKYGQAYPSQATIAKLACCSERTVGRALIWLRLFGFLSWQRRLKRVPSRLGNMVRQTSNSYRLVLQGLAAIGAGILSNGPNRHNCRPSPITTMMSKILAQTG
jgi:hypothetical protein